MITHQSLVISCDHAVTSELKSSLSDDIAIFMSDPSTALYFFKKNKATIRVVLLHFGVIGDSELTYLRDFKKIAKNSEIIILSSHNDVRMAVTIMKEGAFDYLECPIDTHQLLQSIQDARLSATATIKKTTLSPQIPPSDITSLVTTISTQNTLKSESLHTHISSKIDELLTGLPRPAVLVIESDHSPLNAIIPALSAQFYFHQVSSGALAIHTMHKTHIDIVLLDGCLSDCHPVSLVEQLKELDPNIEIIVITDFDSVDIAVNAIQSGATDYLNTPVLENDLRTAIESGLERKYTHYFLPALKKQFIQTRLSFESKCTMLTQLHHERQLDHEPLLMNDIYMFFPELKQSAIPQAFSLPAPVFDQGIQFFIQTLKDTLRSGSVMQTTQSQHSPQH